MAGEWPEVELADLAADRDGAIAIGPFGSAMKADIYSPHGVPIIRGTNISRGRDFVGDWVFIPESFADAMPRCVVVAGDLVFPHRGSIGEVALVPSDRERYFLSTSLMKITLDPRKADPRFVYYYFKSSNGRAEIMKFASQVGTPGIGQPLASLRKFKVPCPPLPSQISIADLLWSLDDKIQLNRRMAATLEATARALFKSWFVDFDPVRAKAEDRPTGLPDDLAAVFPDRLDGDVPNGWPWDSVERLLAVNPRTQLAAETLAPYIDMAALPTDAARVRSVVLRTLGSGSRFINGDTLVARITPCLENGKTALVDLLATNEVGWGSTEFIVLRPHQGVPRAWPYLLARHEPFRAHLIASMSGTSGRQRVPPLAVIQWEMAIPPADVLRAFEAISAPPFARMRALDEEAATLASLRDTLLPKLISGELRIADAEQQIVAA